MTTVIDSDDYLHVVAAVIYDQGKESVLIAKRSDDKHQGGKWEFPGGKVEAGETAHAALERELFEELDIQINAFQPLLEVRHQYADKSVHLDVYEVVQFSGEAIGKEGQEIRWVKIVELAAFTFPSANEEILEAISISDVGHWE